MDIIFNKKLTLFNNLTQRNFASNPIQDDTTQVDVSILLNVQVGVKPRLDGV